MKSILGWLFKRTIRPRFRAAIDRRVDSRLTMILDQRLEAALARHLHDRRSGLIENKSLADKPWKNNIYIPPRDLFAAAPQDPFMPYSTCNSADFLHPRFSEISDMLAIPPIFHRKFWEWVFIVHTALRAGLGPGRRALGFGVGTEPLSSAFAKIGAMVVGTDAPPEIESGAAGRRIM